MAEHLADSFDSDTALLKGRIIKDGTSVIFVSIYQMLLKDGMEAQGDLVRNIRQSMRSFNSVRYNMFLETVQSP